MTRETTVVKELPAEEFKRTWIHENNYKLVKQNNDSRFGDITLLKNPSNQQIIFSKEKVFASKKDATKYIWDMKNRMGINNPYGLQLLDYTVGTQKKLCSTHYVIKSFYTYPHSDARKLMAEHRKASTYFTGQELNKILNDTHQGLSALHARGSYHGDIRPEYIGFN